MNIFWVSATSVFLLGCHTLSPGSDGEHDVQFIQIFFHSGKLDELDTFHGTYQKDLIPGVAITRMWFTTREQEIVLTKLEQTKFFSFPDTIYRLPNVMVSPDHGAQFIRIKYKDRDKTVVWYDPMNPRSKVKYYIESLQSLLNDITWSKPEYKALPPRKGGYL